MNQKPASVMRFADAYYVLATSILADRETRVLKQGETFAIFDAYGDVQPMWHAESGIFHRGTRYLSRLEFMLGDDERPLLLGSTLRDDNGLLKVDMSNYDWNLPGIGFFAKGTLHIHREKFLLDSKCFERIEIRNYSAKTVTPNITLRVNADFADVFEVRGSRRERRGHSEKPTRHGERIHFVYQGLDGLRRAMCLAVDGIALDTARLNLDAQDNFEIRFPLSITGHGSIGFNIELSFHEENEAIDMDPYRDALLRAASSHHAGRKMYCAVRTSNPQFETWMRRSTDDLVMMTTMTDEGSMYPYAGIPWFCAPFGRDGLITALQCLWANPELAKSVLKFLALAQSKEYDSARDAAPGKIIHEIRTGEMANLREVPFDRYYGSVDATPLYLCLAGAYHTRSEDDQTIEELWPSLCSALEWMDRDGDADGDGFIEYSRQTEKGLLHQGWKDSFDSVFHADGRDARGPIALCEVQGYQYLARIEMAKLFERRGQERLAVEQRQKAESLKEKFDREFWLDDMGTFALALDGDKRPCRVKTSNAGQCLFTGIVKQERAHDLVKTLMQPESDSGWGVRTVASDMPRFNPMSYHNGSVWPHDVSLIAWGMAKYGFSREAERLFDALFRAATYMEIMRMPEVFCGFEWRAGEAPTLYPTSCAPQAWAAGSIYLLLRALLGLEINSCEREIRFHHPRLPPSIQSLRISDLLVAGQKIEIAIENHENDVSVQILKRGQGVKVIVEKT